MHSEPLAPADRGPGRPLDGFLAALLSALLPGTGQLLGGKRRRGWVMIAVTGVILGASAVYAWRTGAGLLSLAFRPTFLRWVVVGNGLLLAFRVYSAVDAFIVADRPMARRRGGAAVVAGGSALAIATAALLLAPHIWVGYYDVVQYDLITSLFAPPTTTTEPTTTTSTTTSTAPPTSVPGTSTVAPTTTTTSTSTTSTTLPPFWQGDERINILLLGGDAGVGRVSVRTDTIILASIDPKTGDAALFSVPRNLANVPLPPELSIWPCNCFPPIINELYRWGEEHPAQFPGTTTPGAVAIKAAVSELVGIPVHFYVKVDLVGFTELIDALGGVPITVTERIYDPIYPREDGSTEVIDIPPGEYRMDGHLALAYARSRRQSDDYDRMSRQRCVLESVATEVANPRVLLSSFPRVAEVLKTSVSTDIPLDRVSDLIQLVPLIDTDRIVSLRLVPPTYTGPKTAAGYNTPNLERIRRDVQVAVTLPPEEAIAALGIVSLDDSCG